MSSVSFRPPPGGAGAARLAAPPVLGEASPVQARAFAPTHQPTSYLPLAGALTDCSPAREMALRSSAVLLAAAVFTLLAPARAVIGEACTRASPHQPPQPPLQLEQRGFACRHAPARRAGLQRSPAQRLQAAAALGVAPRPPTATPAAAATSCRCPCLPPNAPACRLRLLQPVLAGGLDRGHAGPHFHVRRQARQLDRRVQVVGHGWAGGGGGRRCSGSAALLMPHLALPVP